KVAEAEAQAIERITAAIKGTGGDPAQYLIAIRYIETLKEMVSGQNNKVVYMPYEATGVLGSLGGIREMLALGPSDKKARTHSPSSPKKNGCFRARCATSPRPKCARACAPWNRQRSSTRRSSRNSSSSASWGSKSLRRTAARAAACS